MDIVQRSINGRVFHVRDLSHEYLLFLICCAALALDSNFLFNAKPMIMCCCMMTSDCLMPVQPKSLMEYAYPYSTGGHTDQRLIPLQSTLKTQSKPGDVCDLFAAPKVGLIHHLGDILARELSMLAQGCVTILQLLQT